MQRNAASLRLFALIALIILVTSYISLSAQSLVLTSPSLSPPPTCPFNPTGVPPHTSPITPFALIASAIAILVSVAFVLMVYLFSKFVPGMAQIQNWIQTEFWEITKSILLIACIFSIITIVSGVAVTISGSGTPGLYTANIDSLVSSTQAYLCGINTYTIAATQRVTGLLVMYGLFKGAVAPDTEPAHIGTTLDTSGLAINIRGIPINLGYVLCLIGPEGCLVGKLAGIEYSSGITFAILNNFLLESNFIYHSQFISLLNDALVFLIFPVEVFYLSEINLLPYLVGIAMGVLIPAGLFFRALPFTRAIGGTLIAMGLGIALIWPSLLVLFNAPVSNYFYRLLTTYNTPTSGPIPLTLAGTGGSCNPAEFGIITPVCNELANKGGVLPDLAHLGGAEVPIPYDSGNPLDYTLLVLSSINSIHGILNYIIHVTLYLIFQFYFLFIIDLIVIYSATDGIAKLLGGTIRLSLGRKLSLV